MAGEPTVTAEETWIPDSGSPRSREEIDAELLVGRYRLGAMIGRGGSGQVHRAEDELAGETVAVKIVRAWSPAVIRQIRRELVALRVLDLPGVVRLKDDGWLRGQRFLVMDLLGGPFDRLTSRGGWDAWQGEALLLLETLARVHFAGVIHRDLKPANVLLDDAGRPVITDFGLAQGQSVETGSGSREGTPRYMAPEQARGEPCDARTDLYAVGGMFAEMLGAGSVPAQVAEVVAAMREEDPANRPSSAVDVLQALGGSPAAVLGTGLDLPEIATESELRSLFDEPPLSYLHIAEDSARILHERTGGARMAVRAELEGWVRAGRCHIVGDRIAMERAAVDRLLWEAAPEARTLADIGRHAPEEAFAAEVLSVADALQRTGRASRAMTVLDVGLSTLDPGPRKTEVLERLVGAALALAHDRALRHAQYRAEQAEAPALARLVAGARMTNSGHAQRAVELLRDPLDGEPELWRAGFLVTALGNTDPARTDEVLARVGERCRDNPVWEGWWQSWCGNAAYARGDFRASLRHHEAAATLLSEHPVARMGLLNNAGLAALEVFELSLARTLAEQAGALAASMRLSHGEAFASWLARAAAYRSAEPLRCEPERVTAAGRVSGRLQAQVAFYEAAIAHRSGDDARAVELALVAAEGFAGSFRPAAVMARALARASGWARDATSDLSSLPELALPMRLQTLALLVGAGAVAAPEPEVWAAWVDAWPAPDPELRLDVLSLRECRERLSDQGWKGSKTP